MMAGNPQPRRIDKKLPLLLLLKEESELFTVVKYYSGKAGLGQ
jgi:hypothetical protein